MHLERTLSKSALLLGKLNPKLLVPMALVVFAILSIFSKPGPLELISFLGVLLTAYIWQQLAKSTAPPPAAQAQTETPKEIIVVRYTPSEKETDFFQGVLPIWQNHVVSVKDKNRDRCCPVN